MHGMQVWSLGGEYPLEQEMAIHSGILAWEIPWTEEPGGLQSMGLEKVRYGWVAEHMHAHTHIFSLIIFIKLGNHTYQIFKILLRRVIRVLTASVHFFSLLQRISLCEYIQI